MTSARRPHSPVPPGTQAGERDTGAAVCVVVGATGAIGSAVTHRLVQQGRTVLAVGRDCRALDDLAEQNALVQPCVADIADNSSIDVISTALGGRVDMALFAAGLPVRGSVDSIDPDDLTRAANIKVAGVARLLHAVRDHLDDGSRFVAVAGSLGIEPGPLDAGPGTANAALLNLMRQISVLYGPRGVTVHTVAPGPLDTPRLHRFVETEAAETGAAAETIWQRYRDRTSLGRLPTLGEVSWLITRLLDAEGAALHGAVLAVDGGVRRGIL